MARHFGVVCQTLLNWAEAHPEFAEAYAAAHDLALAWWEYVAHQAFIKGEPPDQCRSITKFFCPLSSDEYRERQGGKGSCMVEPEVIVIGQGPE